MNRLIAILKKNDGFSLIEAIITIVIVGIAIVPISMVFTRTVDTTLYTRRQLQANELAQGYVETLRTKNFDDLALIFGSGVTSSSVTYDSATAEANGLSSMPDRYRVTLNYTSSDFDAQPYALPAGNTELPVDVIVRIVDLDLPQIFVDDGATTTILTSSPTLPRDITINVDRTSKKYTIIYGGDSYTTINPLTNNAIRLVMGDKIATEATTSDDLVTSITFNSNMAEKINAYFYEGSDLINATTNVDSGYISISRNLNFAESIKRIVEIEAIITDTISGDVMATFTTTKIHE